MRKVLEVRLNMFEDDANGEWGLAPEKCIDSDISFNAFWNGQGMFHDVFEHYHEHEHKYFRGDYSMNIGGEMVASGATSYYYFELGIYERLLTSYRSPDDSIADTTASDVVEAIEYGGAMFGYTLESNVPYQRPINCTTDYIAEMCWEQCKSANPERAEEYEVEQARDYKDSVTKAKITNLHRYGHRMAERLIPNNCHNQEKLSEFLEFWNKVCKNNVAEELQYYMSGITFQILREGGYIEWKAICRSAEHNVGDVVIDSRKLEDYQCHLHDLIMEKYDKEYTN